MRLTLFKLAGNTPMKNVSLLLAIMWIVACSSSYTPTEAMLKYKQNMSVVDAQAALQAVIWNEAEPFRVCGSRGFWYDDGSDMRVREKALTLQAYKKGQYLHSKGTGFDRRDYYDKEYYDYALSFADIQKVVLYYDPSVLTVFKDCKDSYISQHYIVMDFYQDKNTNLKFIVLHEELDQLIAAISILMPDKPIEVHKKLGS